MEWKETSRNSKRTSAVTATQHHTLQHKSLDSLLSTYHMIKCNMRYQPNVRHTILSKYCCVMNLMMALRIKVCTSYEPHVNYIDIHLASRV